MLKTKIPYSQKLKTISTFRRLGDVTRTSNQTGYSRSYVSEVFSGLYRNEDIVNYGFKMANGRKTRSES